MCVAWLIFLLLWFGYTGFGFFAVCLKSTEINHIDWLTMKIFVYWYSIFHLLSFRLESVHRPGLIKFKCISFNILLLMSEHVWVSTYKLTERMQQLTSPSIEFNALKLDSILNRFRDWLTWQFEKCSKSISDVTHECEKRKKKIVPCTQNTIFNLFHCFVRYTRNEVLFRTFSSEISEY